MITMKTGNTGASIYVTKTQDPRDRSKDIEAVIKMHGIRSSMVHESRIPQMMKLYQNGNIHYDANEQSRVRTLLQLQYDCGFGDINIHEWMAPIRTVVEETGERIEEAEGIFAEFARGASVEALVGRYNFEDLSDIMQRIPHDRVITAALFDFMTAQHDRHGENVFVTDEGGLQLIDTRDSVFGMLDTIWHPGTWYFERNVVGNEGLFNPPEEQKRKPDHWPQLMLDYRCHVPNGTIGFEFPPKMRACMEKISSMSIEGLLKEYGISERSKAQLLHNASSNGLKYGYEAAVRMTPLPIRSKKYQPPEGYRWREPCCQLTNVDDPATVECVNTLLPPGEPGAKWWPSSFDL